METKIWNKIFFTEILSIDKLLHRAKNMIQSNCN